MQTKNKPMRIIVVEDNESLRKGLCYRLEDEGYAVDALEDGLVADEFLRSEGGDLVVLDINLPGQSGLEVLSDECEPVSGGTVSLSLIPHKGRAIRSERQFCSS